MQAMLHSAARGIASGNLRCVLIGESRQPDRLSIVSTIEMSALLSESEMRRNVLERQDSARSRSLCFTYERVRVSVSMRVCACKRESESVGDMSTCTYNNSNVYEPTIL